MWVAELCNSHDPFAKSYGYFWYTATTEVAGKHYDCVYASGNGGNLLLVVPGEKLVVSLTSSAYGQGYGHKRSRTIFTHVLKALKKKQAAVSIVGVQKLL